MTSGERPFRRPVVVGVDGSAKDELAVPWAADEAAWRGTDLLVLYAFDRVAPLPTVYAAVQRVTSAARATVTARRPQLVVRTREVLGDPTAALLDLSRAASVVVLGAGGRGRLTSTVLGSVSRAVVSRGHGTVVVVTGRRSPPGAPVTVGVDLASEGTVPLTFALEEAARRAAPLRVLHSAAGRGTPEGPSELDVLLTRACEAFPGVPVEVVRTSLDPAAALTDEGERSCLLVVGRPRHGAARGPSSVVQAVLHAAPAVAVVAARAGGAERAGGAAPRAAARG
jgi:nucleotide-binding universal stress UspA family protein